jgi:hypothetical protein
MVSVCSWYLAQIALTVCPPHLLDATFVVLLPSCGLFYFFCVVFCVLNTPAISSVLEEFSNVSYFFSDVCECGPFYFLFLSPYQWFL